MPDLIRIIQMKGADANGNGGTVVNRSNFVLPEEDAASVLDKIALAFDRAYGREVPNPDYSDTGTGTGPEFITVDPHQNLAWRLLFYAEEILKGDDVRDSEEQATQSARRRADLRKRQRRLLRNGA